MPCEPPTPQVTFLLVRVNRDSAPKQILELFKAVQPDRGFIVREGKIPYACV